MEPLLKENDHILVRKGRLPEAGDVAVFYGPDGLLHVKTCLLSQGDRVVTEGHYLIARGNRFFLQPRQREYLSRIKKVPEGRFFMVGENSFHSEDSREWGFIDEKEILGRVIGKKSRPGDRQNGQ